MRGVACCPEDEELLQEGATEAVALLRLRNLVRSFPSFSPFQLKNPQPNTPVQCMPDALC